MEGAEEVGLVLARASELRSKIDRCILENVAERRRSDGDALGLLCRIEGGGGGEEEEKDEDDGEQEEESLIDVRDALESLEHQLSSLQVPLSSSLPCRTYIGYASSLRVWCETFFFSISPVHVMTLMLRGTTVPIERLFSQNFAIV